jgi:peptidoglycan glycosyltransferase
MSRQIRALGTLLLVLIAVLAILTGYWQAIAAGSLSSAPQNPRIFQDDRRALRGRILDYAGNVVVESRDDGSRRLAVPSLGHVVGYRSARYGTTGVELAEDAALSGTGGPLSTDDLIRQVAQLPGRGADVSLTIDHDVQFAAGTALGTSGGSIVVLDTRSGAVLAMASNPVLDTDGIEARWASLLADPAKPLVNRAAQGLYVPGSTFKLVTAAAAIDLGIVTPATSVSDPTGETVIDGFRITDAERPPRAAFDFAHAFAWSSNVVFADVGLKIGEARLREVAARFGIGTALALGIATSSSSLSRTSPMPPSLLASTAFGQGELLLSPLQVVVVAATIARDGDVPRPWIVAEVQARGDTGTRTLRRTKPASLGRAVSAQTAGALRALMGLAVEDGSSKAAAIPGVRIGGKTGTAQSVPGQPDHAWFVGIAPLDAPRVAIVVLREFGGWGSEAAAPLARPVLQSALQATSLRRY